MSLAAACQLVRVCCTMVLRLSTVHAQVPNVGISIKMTSINPNSFSTQNYISSTTKKESGKERKTSA